MGLDFTAACVDNLPHWSYGGFNHFRIKLAEQIGINLNGMDRFGGNKSWDDIDHPIKSLLHHSDCDGELTPDECKQIAKELRNVVQATFGTPTPDESLSDLNTDEPLPDNDHFSNGYDYDLQNGLLLANAIEKCAEHNEPLIFC